MLNLIKKVIGFIIKLCSCLTFRSKKIFLFGSWFGEKYTDNPKAMYLHYLNNTNYTVYWVTKNKQIYTQLKKEKKPVLMINSLKSIFIHLHAGTAFICTGPDVNLNLLGRATIVQLWHGVGGGKKVGLDAGWYHSKLSRFLFKLDRNIFKNYIWITTSETFVNIFIRTFMMTKNQFYICGQPRNDVFFKDLDKTDIKISLNIDEKKKIILYVPTHRLEGKKKFPFEENFDLCSLNKLCEDNGFIFVIKKHFYHKNEKIYLDEFKNIMDVTNSTIDINDLLMISDIIISDYSSVTADILLLKKTIIYYCFDYDDYIKNDRDMYWNYKEISPGYICTNFSDLLKALNKTILCDDFVKERERVRKLFYDDCCLTECAPRIESIVHDVLNKNKF